MLKSNSYTLFFPKSMQRFPQDLSLLLTRWQELAEYILKQHTTQPQMKMLILIKLEHTIPVN